MMNKYSLVQYNDSIESRWTARHAFSSKLATLSMLDFILNIGCYNGWLESTLLSSGKRRIVSIDITRKNIEKAKRSVPQVDYVVASAVNLPFKKGAFQLMTMFEVIEHIPKYMEKTCLGECNRVLQNGGKLLLSTPFNSLKSKFLDPAWYLGHRHYSVSHLILIGQKTSFVQTKTYICGGLFESVTMILLYFFKPFGFEIPFKMWFEHHRQSEYHEKGFNTIFIVFERSMNYTDGQKQGKNND